MSPNLATYLQADGSIDQILLLCLWYYWKIRIPVITIFKALYIAIDVFAMSIISVPFFLSLFWGINIIMHQEVHWTNVPHAPMQFWLLNLCYHFKTSVILLEQLVGWWWKQCQGSGKADLPASRHLESFHWPPLTTTFVNSVEERYVILTGEKKPF